MKLTGIEVQTEEIGTGKEICAWVLPYLPWHKVLHNHGVLYDAAALSHVNYFPLVLVLGI